MRFLLDMPVSASLIDVLETHGHEGIHAYQIGRDRAPDDELLARVLQEVPAEILDKSISVVDKRQVRVTTLPLDRQH